ncbi:PREDICTED: uncharacterized protein LOC108978485 [Bactrocera latifrons]|uniref:uncharacterized protein LOC108978485 n=1 Tax=Bactrocera latifrons TaxID=174628 RepID=UPI0008DC9119|nr:PREDICTED: uncharacterized protein LOC108978485 [Bactrocera latifrons]
MLILSKTIFLLAIIIGCAEGKFKFTNIKCHSTNESFAKFKTCRLKAVRRNINELSLYVKLLQLPIDNVKIVLQLKKRNDYRNRSIYEFGIDACAFLRNKRRNPLADLFYRFSGLKSHSNANHTCPYDHDIILDRYFIDDKLSSFIPLPAGFYEIQTRWETDGVKRGNVDGVIEAYD